jgi:hypothetical protein
MGTVEEAMERYLAHVDDAVASMSILRVLM